MTPCSHLKIHGRILYCNSLTAESDVSAIHGRVEEVDLIIIYTKEGGGSIFVLNAGKIQPDYTASHSRTRQCDIYSTH